MIKDKLCFVCVPFSTNERGARCKDPSSGVDYPSLHMMACDGVERAGYIPMSPLQLWDYYYLEDLWGERSKREIIHYGAELIELCECFYFCDCEYDEDMHIEMKLWHDRAKALKKEFVRIDRKFLK